MADQGADEYDVIVVGGGPPGENAASYAVQGGLSAALVEKELLGGECSYWACIPSKALLRPVEALAAARALPGVRADAQLDVGPVLARRDSFVAGHDDSSQVGWAEGVPITVVRGEGVLDGEKRVVVRSGDGSQRVLTARHAVVLATGTSAAVPPVEGLREAHPWTSRDVTNLHEVPPRVVLVGGGVVACEAAQWLRALGTTELHLVEHGPRLLGKMEPFAGELVADRFRELGVSLHLGRACVAVRRGEVATTAEGHPRGAEVTVVLDDGTELVADEFVVAAGRHPNSEGIGLESVGLPAGGYVEVDDHLIVTGVSGGWLYAVGDITGRALLTHQGKYQARVCGDVIAARAKGLPLLDRRYRAFADHAAVPQVAFTDPQAGSVGLTLRDARAAGLTVEAVEYDLGRVSGAALERDGYVGRANLVVDTVRQVVVGATFVGSDIAELVHSATIAVVGEVPLDVLWHAVPSFPTKSEVWLRLLEAWRSERG